MTDILFNPACDTCTCVGDVDGGLWGDTGSILTNNTIRGSARTAQHLYVVGIFTTVTDRRGTYARGGAALLNISTGLWDQTFAPSVTGTPFGCALDLEEDGLFIVGDISAIAGTTRRGIGKVHATTGVLDAFDAGLNVGAVVVGLLLTPSSLYLAGQFLVSLRRNVIKTDPLTGAIDTGFNAQPGSPGQAAYSLQSTGGFLYIGGNEVAYSATTRNHYAAVDSTIGTLQAFNPDVQPTGPGPVRGQFYDGNDIFFVGDFTQVAGVTRRRAAKVDLFAVLQAWDPNVTGGTTVMTFVVGADFNDVWLLGDFTAAGGLTRNSIARVDGGAGAGVSGFNATMSTNSLLYTASEYDTTRYGTILIVGGAFSGTTFSGGARFNIVFLNRETGALLP